MTRPPLQIDNHKVEFSATRGDLVRLVIDLGQAIAVQGNAVLALPSGNNDQTVRLIKESADRLESVTTFVKSLVALGGGAAGGG